MREVGTHHGEGHRSLYQAVGHEDCELGTRVGQYEEDAGYYEREDAAFWVPHQQRQGEMVEFDGFTVTIDDIITQCGYREEDKEWLTAVHRRSMESFLKAYRGTVNGQIPLLE